MTQKLIHLNFPVPPNCRSSRPPSPQKLTFSFGNWFPKYPLLEGPFTTPQILLLSRTRTSPSNLQKPFTSDSPLRSTTHSGFAPTSGHNRPTRTSCNPLRHLDRDKLHPLQIPSGTKNAYRNSSLFPSHRSRRAHMIRNGTDFSWQRKFFTSPEWLHQNPEK